MAVLTLDVVISDEAAVVMASCSRRLSVPMADGVAEGIAVHMLHLLAREYGLSLICVEFDPATAVNVIIAGIPLVIVKLLTFWRILTALVL